VWFFKDIEMDMTVEQNVGYQAITYAQHKSIRLNDADYCYLEAGEGPMLLLLHGYPDNAYSWEQQIRFLSAAGYRVIVPFLRGYQPTHVATGSFFDRATIANDMSVLIDKLNDSAPVLLVGQDWGAAISYGILGAFSEKVTRAMILAVPHTLEINRTLKRSPKHCFRSFHWFLFQLPWLPELIIRGSRGRFLSCLWKLWSPKFSDQKHVDHIIKTLLWGNGVEDTLAYYRAAVQAKFRDPRLSGLFERLNDTITVPTKVLCGKKDMRKEMLPRAADCFAESADYQWELVEDAGHFLHREKPEVINQAILHWFKQ
jgi:pimeloyl-ACP methyl ester carboxylesterase